MCLADLFFDPALVLKEGLQRLVEVFLDEVFDELIVHPDDPDEQRDGQGIELGCVEFEDDLGQNLGGDIRRSAGIHHDQVVALLDEGADLLER